MRMLWTGWIWVWSGLAQAQDVGDAATEQLFDCSQPIEQVIDEIQRVSKLEVYLCLHNRQDAGSALLARRARSGLQRSFPK